MQHLTNFFEWINKVLGISGAGELVTHPVFIGICVLLLLYGVARRRKFMVLGLGGLMGSTVIFHYLYPADSTNLTDLITFIAAMGLLALLLVYFAFVRE
jgi:hypothetical protein